jgi:methylphosphotriester-DNA--protein-cysteine methyltransferase
MYGSENRQHVAAREGFPHGTARPQDLLPRLPEPRCPLRRARFAGVTSTGIYCRPICPARTPKLANCRFYASAAAAQEAGFRPCLRCRPEIAPDLAFWRGTANTVSRALALIADGALDDDAPGDKGAGVEALAARLGVGGRQLRRLFQRHLGASPVAVAQTRRVLFAKQLLHDTRLPMAEVALAAGFGSVRRFARPSAACSAGRPVRCAVHYAARPAPTPRRATA